MHAGRVFTHQQHGLGIQHRHHGDRAMAATMQALVKTPLAVGKLQVELLQPVWAGVVLGDPVDDGQAPGHAQTPVSAPAGIMRG